MDTVTETRSYKKALYKRLYSAKETYNFQEPTNHSHPILRALVSGDDRVSGRDSIIVTREQQIAK